MGHKDHKHKKEKKKKKKAESSSESASESDSERETRKHKKREDRDREERLRQQKLEEKARRKAIETPEQRNARRLLKKQKKKETEQEEKKLFGFTNEANPFGDPNLTKPFKWRSKLMHDMKQGKIQRPQTKNELREKQLALRSEIEKVKERKAAREVELEQMEEMRLQVERDAMREQLAGWEEKEEQFHRKQAKERTKIRIKEGREKAVDILAKNLHLFEGEELPSEAPSSLDVELTEPHKIFNGLNSRDLEDLRRDLKTYIDMGANLEYWNALVVMCDDEIGKVKNNNMRANYGLNNSFLKDIKSLLENKNESELIKIEREITNKLENQQAHVDIAYWEALLKMLPVFKAKAYLTEFYATLLKKRLKQLKAQSSSKKSKRGRGSSDEEVEAPKPKKGETSKKKVIVYEEDGDLSPMLEEGSDEDAIDPDDDRRQLEAHRALISEQKTRELRADVQKSINKESEDAEEAAAVRAAGMNRFLMSGDELFQKEANKPMEDDDEEAFNSELSTPTQVYWWHDKYRPRKPRYFNRVKTGFDWNKYNQTHYDKENPPPKTVQGYKFNIFYPDLIDPSKPPRYQTEDSEDSNDHCIIRFVAGPPYEDVAFKIVKKEWDVSHKRGYKCVFDKGVLHLYFNFRRYRYRR